jgi:2-C-methyl-D-erythritol 4-phosphate cytidylyltransferase
MTVALIVAAGSGERLGASVPKAFVEVAGRPMLDWSLDALERTESISHIVTALPPGRLTATIDARGAPAPPRETVPGGASRSESVRRALEAAPEDELVLVHDAARPLLTPEIAGSVISALREDPEAQAAIAAAPVTDTIKRAPDARVVVETLPRSDLWAVQTPQVFRRDALRQALEASPEELAAATDDASLIEQRGGRVLLVPTSPQNIKVTTALDLRVAELLLLARERDPA